MAGKEISQLYCWNMEIDELKINMASSEKGAVRVEISFDSADPVEYFKALFPLSKMEKNREMNNTLIEALKGAMGGLAAVPVPTDIECTPFQRDVLERIAMIPFGETRTYGDIARIIGKPGGARAIGQVMNKNPLPLIYP